MRAFLWTDLSTKICVTGKTAIQSEKRLEKKNTTVGYSKIVLRTLNGESVRTPLLFNTFNVLSNWTTTISVRIPRLSPSRFPYENRYDNEWLGIKKWVPKIIRKWDESDTITIFFCVHWFWVRLSVCSPEFSRLNSRCSYWYSFASLMD